MINLPNRAVFSAAFSAVFSVFMVLATSAALALPALQLGPGSGNWTYSTTSETWIASGNPVNLNAYANATSILDGNGDYAWDSAGASSQIGYLVISAVPHIGFDGFDVTVSNDSGNLSLYTSGVGAAPLQDTNSLAPHGIFDTYFEIYQFDFDGALSDIFDTQPGTTGTGKGYIENFDIIINSLAAGVDGIHFDLFSVSGDGVLDLASLGKNIVKEFAPFSHDAGTVDVSEPTPLAILGFGLLALGWIHSYRRRAVRA